MTKVYSYPFGTVSVFDQYLIAVMNEGITVTPDLNDILEELAIESFGSKKFAYITHRINSYSVDPKIYIKTSKISNLVGFAVVNGEKIVIDNTEIERLFLNKPFKTFLNINDAISWAKELCQ